MGVIVAEKHAYLGLVDCLMNQAVGRREAGWGEA